MVGDFKLDELNKKILEILWENARLSFAEIGKQVHLSAPAVADRVRKMEEAGVIEGYRVQINREAIGRPVSAFILMKVFHGREQAFIDFIQKQDEVESCVNVTGEKGFIVQVSLKSINQLDDFLERCTNVGETTTMIVLSTIIHSHLFFSTS